MIINRELPRAAPGKSGFFMYRRRGGAYHRLYRYSRPYAVNARVDDKIRNVLESATSSSAHQTDLPTTRGRQRQNSRFTRRARARMRARAFAFACEQTRNWSERAELQGHRNRTPVGAAHAHFTSVSLGVRVITTLS